MTVMLLITGAALSLSLSSRSLYESDEARTRMQQGIKASKDLLSMDIRQVGERLPPDFPSVEIIRGEDLPGGVAGDPDQLILRRNLIATVMNSCRDVSGNIQLIYIHETINSPVPPGCDPLPDGDGDGWPDDHKIWSDYRESYGEVYGSSKYVWAYLYNPTTQQGEFFKYLSDQPLFGTISAASDTTWTHNYPVSDRPRIYILEERRYAVSGDMLQLTINGDTGQAINLMDGVDDFQLLAHLQSSPTQDAFGVADDWMDLRGIEIGMDASVDVRGKLLEHGWSSMIMPRNVLSR